MTRQPEMIQAKNLPAQLDSLISDLRAATKDEVADEAIISILNRFVAAPDAADSILPDFAEDDVVLFEDDTLSVWFCRFQPGAPCHRMTTASPRPLPLSRVPNRMISSQLMTRDG